MLTIETENGKQRVTGSWLVSQELLLGYAEEMWDRGFGYHPDEEYLEENPEQDPFIFDYLTVAQKLACIDEHNIDDARNYSRYNKNKKLEAAKKLDLAAYEDEFLSIE